VSYYQQVGRAGRAVPRAEAWLLPSPDDRRIWDWFGSVGLPAEPLVARVLAVLGDRPRSIADIEAAVDLSRSRLTMLLKILDVDGAIRRVEGGWVRTGSDWTYDTERVERIRRARDVEADAMEAYGQTSGCLMAFLRRQLDDTEADRCGRCANCTGRVDPVEIDPSVVRAAALHLRRTEIVLEPRKQWPRGVDDVRGSIKPGLRAELGRALARVGDSAWWPVVEAAFARGRADDELVEGLRGLLAAWPLAEQPTWVTWVPSRRRGSLLADVAGRVADLLGGVAVVPAFTRSDNRAYQEQFENSAHRLGNVWPHLALDAGTVPGDLLRRAVLLLDDTAETRWTLTAAAARLRSAGVPAVHPLVLAAR
jgi:ATP-dependent DNA helicase RecQ